MVEETDVPGGNYRCVIRAENPYYTVQLILSSAESWDQTHTLHRLWLQGCKSNTSDAP
jgi:hypothetical protein